MKQIRDLMAHIDAIASRDSGLRMALRLKFYERLTTAVAKGRGDQEYATIMSEIPNLLEAARISRVERRRSHKAKPARPGPGYAREWLDEMRVKVGLRPIKRSRKVRNIEST